MCLLADVIYFKCHRRLSPSVRTHHNAINIHKRTVECDIGDTSLRNTKPIQGVLIMSWICFSLRSVKSRSKLVKVDMVICSGTSANFVHFLYSAIL